MRSSKVEKFFQEALNKMFQAVGFETFDPEFAKQDKWYTLKTWSLEEEKTFKEWFMQKAKKDLGWSKATTEKELSYFNLMYGWSSQEPIENLQGEEISNIQYQ